MRQTWQYVLDGVVHEPLRLLVTIVAIVVGAAALAVLPGCSVVFGTIGYAHCPNGDAHAECPEGFVQSCWCDVETGAGACGCVQQELPKPEPKPEPAGD